MTQSDIIIVFVMNKSVPMSVLIDESDIIIVFVTGCIYRYIMCTVCFSLRVVVALQNKNAARWRRGVHKEGRYSVTVHVR